MADDQTPLTATGAARVGLTGATRVDQNDLGSPPRRSGGGRIAYLQYLRAIAAGSVLLYHASYYLASLRAEPTMLALFGDRFGNFGVSLFFAISGYLMAALAERASPATFLVHRIIRIYPIYWLTAAGVLGLHHLLGEGAVFDPMAFGLIPGGPHYYLLGVEWTLPFELTFYLMVFFVILLRAQRLLPALAAAWVIGHSVALVRWPHLQQGQFPTLFYIPFAEKSLAFAAGLLIPFALRRGLIGAATPIIALALLMGSEAVPLLQPWLMNFGCALLVAAAVLPRQAPRHGADNPGVALGDWSFALYLVHVPIVIWIYRFAPVTSPPLAVWFAAIGAALGGAVLVGSFDMAMYARLKRRVDRASPWFRIALATVFVLVIMGFGTRAVVEQPRRPGWRGRRQAPGDG
jgi:peptidoglycan/LPS O-acetylase OafA/YrhL